jgi:hypothetical protein
MKITPESTRRPKVVGCDYRYNDGSLCAWRFEGELGDSLERVRWRARQHDWACNDPGPGRPASDRCPRHLEQTEGAS